MTSGASSSNPTAKYISSELLEIAIELAQTGDKEAVRELLQLIVKENPSDELAWIWYANTSPTIQERIRTLEEFRKRNPENQRIRYLCESLTGSIAEGENAIADGSFLGNTYTCPNYANTNANTYLTCPSCGAEATPLRPLSLPTSAQPTPASEVNPLQLSFLDQLALEPIQLGAQIYRPENYKTRRNHLGLALDLYISGEKEGARELLEAITKEDPKNELAWIWYANTFPTSRERIQVLYKFLAFNPQNQRVHDYCKYLREAIETPEEIVSNGPSPTYTHPGDLLEPNLPAASPNPEIGIVDIVQRSQYYKPLARSPKTPAHKSNPILIGLTGSTHQLRCPNCLRYLSIERHPINWKLAILNSFLIIITLGLWTIYLLRTGTSVGESNKKYICTICGYLWD